MLLDFTSSLYLGFLHGSRELKPWRQISSGRPAVLQSSATAEHIGATLAHLQGCEAGVVGPSTLHLFWDLFNVLARTERKPAIFFDGGLYPIGRWGVERATAHGVLAQPFREHDASDLRRRLGRSLPSNARPILVTDGMRPGRWGPAPLGAYLKLMREYGGYLIVDDTQALGILGRDPSREWPYGSGGGGSLRWHGINGPEMVTISSLAKGFGVPMAVLAGSQEMIRRFVRLSETRVHCSPPSNAAVNAAAHALESNLTKGEKRRHRLLQLVQYFRRCLSSSGFAATGGPFPVQTLIASAKETAAEQYRRMWSHGVRTVLQRGDEEASARISWLITAYHQFDDIDRGVRILASIYDLGSARMKGGRL